MSGRTRIRLLLGRRACTVCYLSPLRCHLSSDKDKHDLLILDWPLPPSIPLILHKV